MFKYKCYYIFPGGLFHPGDDNQVLAFRYAVDIINQDSSMLPRSKLSAQVETISPYDSFHASKKGETYPPKFIWLWLNSKKITEIFDLFLNAVCNLLGSGVAAIFGPQSSQTASHVQSICDTMEVSEIIYIYIKIVYMPNENN